MTSAPAEQAPTAAELRDALPRQRLQYRRCSTRRPASATGSSATAHVEQAGFTQISMTAARRRMPIHRHEVRSGTDGFLPDQRCGLGSQDPAEGAERLVEGVDALGLQRGADLVQVDA